MTITPAAAPTICPYCARSVPLGAQACTACGAPLPTYTPLAPGQTLASGRYTIQRLLSRSGLIALAADHTTFDRLVVVKEMLDAFDPAAPQQAQAAAARFLQEAQTLATLQHPAVPQLCGYFQDGPHNYLVMEYVEGDNLAQGLTRVDRATGAIIPGTHYDLEDVLRWGVTLCQALEHLASRQPHPALHRDIKPANLVIDRGSGDVRLVNFGGSTTRPLALSGGDQTSHAPLMGTHGYAAPEQYTGQSEPRSDVYALAATLYHLASDDDPRAHPFEFPRLERLGRLGQALDAALQLDVAARLDAAGLLRRLEGMAGAAGARTIQAPDGVEIPDMAALAGWCERHWKEAGPWVTGALPEQIERLWGKIRLSQELRALQQQHHADPHAFLDAALALLDPAGFGAAAPQLSYPWPAIDFGPRTSDERASASMRLTNRGRRYVQAQIRLPQWLSASPQKVTLAPGEQETITLYADMTRVAATGKVREDIGFYSGATPALTVEARATISRWRTIWRRFGLLIVVAVVVSTVLLWNAITTYQANLLAERYQSGQSALARKDWPAAHAAFAGLRGYRNADELLSESYYREGVAAMNRGDWTAARVALTKSGGYQDATSLWRQASDRIARQNGMLLKMEGRSGWIDTIAWNADGQTLITVSTLDQSIRVWRLSDGALLRIIADYSRSSHYTAVSPDGQLAAQGTYEGALEIHRLADGKLLSTLKKEFGTALSIVFSPDGRLIATTDSYRTVVSVWRLSDGALLASIKATTGTLTGAAFSPDGQMLATTNSDNVVRLWRLSDGEQLVALKGHSLYLGGVAWSPDGQLIATFADDGAVKLWRASDGQLLASLESRAGREGALAFSLDGQLLAAGDWMGIKLWRVSDGQLVKTIEGNASGVSSLVFSPDGQTLASGNEDGTVMLWPVHP